MTASLSSETREKLATVSTATLTTQMYKRGFRNVFIQGVGRLTTAHDRNMVGPAFTLRYICLLYTSPRPRDRSLSRMPSTA